MAADNLKASPEQLAEAVSGPMQSRHRRVLAMQLEELDLLDKHIAELSRQWGDALRFHQDAVLRLCEMPGVREDAAWQMIAELGPVAATFETAEQMASWIGVCPGGKRGRRVQEQPVAEGNRTMRHVLNQVAWSAVRTKDSFFRELYHRLIPRLGVHNAIWAIAHRMAKVMWKILHDKVSLHRAGTVGIGSRGNEAGGDETRSPNAAAGLHHRTQTRCRLYYLKAVPQEADVFESVVMALRAKGELRSP
jgi:transposase